MADPKKKNGLAILLALGKKKPTDEKPSYEAPEEGAEDEGEEGLAAGGNEPETEGAEIGSEEGAGENMIALPKGFKPPGDAMDGEPFTTTVRGKVVDGKLQVMALGDIPIKSETEETPEEEAAETPEEEGAEEATGTEEPQGPGMIAAMPPARKKGGLVKGTGMPQHRLDQMKSMKKKAMDEMAARNVFQRGR